MSKDLPVSPSRSKHGLLRFFIPKREEPRQAVYPFNLFPLRRPRGTAAVCLLLLAGLGVVLWQSVGASDTSEGTPNMPSDLPGQVIEGGGSLPSEDLLGSEEQTTEAMPDEELDSYEEETDPAESTAPPSCDGEADTVQPDGTTAPPTESESATYPDERETGGASDEPAEPDFPNDSETTIDSDTPCVTEPSESEPPREPPEESAEETTEEETAAEEPVPEGCIPIQLLDMSMKDRGSGYVIRESGGLPPSLPVGGLWATEGMPAVLVVNTHPYAGYHNGGSYYDPAEGGLAQAQSPMDPEGTVALGAALTSYLRGQGVTVIHLRISVSPGETSSVIRERTETMIRHYCRLYPDIGLVLDLGRSAEMTEEGGILQTQAQYRGEACAQLRMTVSGSRPSDATGRDLAAALALRQALWEEEPTLCRPVRVVEGGGLASELLDVRVLTLELGAAGNTYAEAKALLKPLGDALCRILGNS